MDFQKYNGWALVKHPLLSDQLDELGKTIESKANPSREIKILKMITRLMREDIPADPAAAKFRQGLTLGDENRHWRRAVFFQQYRLFFRYDSRAKVIIYVWVKGHPPNDFEELLKQSGFKNTLN